MEAVCGTEKLTMALGRDAAKVIPIHRRRGSAPAKKLSALPSPRKVIPLQMNHAHRMRRFEAGSTAILIAASIVAGLAVARLLLTRSAPPTAAAPLQMRR
jgi:hypothetical protein